MSFDFKEFIELRNKFVEMEKGWDKFIYDFLLEMGLRLLAKTKLRQRTVKAIDTGLMQNSWQLGEIKRVGDALEIEIFNLVEYASYVEYGHKQEVGRYVPALGKKLKQPWVKGRYIATVSINSMEKEIPKRFDKAFKDWIKKLGVE